MGGIQLSSMEIKYLAKFVSIREATKADLNDSRVVTRECFFDVPNEETVIARAWGLYNIW